MTSILHMALYIHNSHNIPLRKKGIIIIVYTAIFKGLPWWLSGKESCCNAGDASSLGWEDPLEEGMATHSSILAWRIPWTEEPGGL